MSSSGCFSAITQIATVSDMERDKPKYPNRLRECLAAAGLTQAELARRLGVATQSIGNLVTQDRKLHSGWLQRLKTVLPYTADELLTSGPSGSEGGEDVQVISLPLDVLMRIERNSKRQTELMEEFIKLRRAELAREGPVKPQPKPVRKESKKRTG
jgi:transcriptional regulator with XRE-family HTH domain